MVVNTTSYDIYTGEVVNTATDIPNKPHRTVIHGHALRVTQSSSSSYIPWYTCWYDDDDDDDDDDDR